MNQPADNGLARVLPSSAAELLRKAAQTVCPADDPTRRLRAIEDAERIIRLRYPNHFKWEL